MGLLDRFFRFFFKFVVLGSNGSDFVFLFKWGVLFVGLNKNNNFFIF